MSRLKWLFLILHRHYRNMGLRVALYALLSLLAAFVSSIGAAWVNDFARIEMSFSSVLPVLTILASSMLAVSTFSLNIMVSAHRAAAAATTPRVHRILLEDTTTQSVLAAFIGAFVYSLGSIILYRAGFYTEEAALLVMGLTILVVVGVVVSLLRWISHLTTLGSVDESLRVASRRAESVLVALGRHPCFGARPLTDDTVIPLDTRPLPARASGFVQIVDLAQIEACLEGAAAVYVIASPGRHVLEGETVAHVSGTVSEDAFETLKRAFTIGDTRTHEQDAEFGLAVLAETASRALSPGINDPGTAIHALSLLKALLWTFASTSPNAGAASLPSVYARFPDANDLVSVAFAPIARDGAGTIEVVLHLRRALKSLAECSDTGVSEAASAMAETAMAYAEAADLLDHERAELRAIEF